MAWKDKRGKWKKNGPPEMPAALLPYWKRIVDSLPISKLYESDSDALMLIAGALHDSEQGLGEAEEAPMMNSRRAARKEYGEAVTVFREVVAGREEEAPRRREKAPSKIEDYVK